MKDHTNLMYADYIILVTTSQDGLQDLVSCVEKDAKECNIIINAVKMKVMTNTSLERHLRLW